MGAQLVESQTASFFYDGDVTGGEELKIGVVCAI